MTAKCAVIRHYFKHLVYSSLLLLLLLLLFGEHEQQLCVLHIEHLFGGCWSNMSSGVMTNHATYSYTLRFHIPLFSRFCGYSVLCLPHTTEYIYDLKIKK